VSNVFCFIPARAGSKQIPNKNIKELGSKPLIVWTIECALKAGLSRVIVNTDGEEIAKIAREAGAEVMIRPAQLAKDETTMFQVLNSEIPKIEPLPEMVLLLQPTSPFRKKIHIKLAIEILSKSPEYDSLLSVERIPEKYHPAQVIIMTPLGPRMANGAPISQRSARRQDFPIAYLPTGSIYLFRTKNLKTGSFYSEKIALLETEPEININDFNDFEKAANYLSALTKNGSS